MHVLVFPQHCATLCECDIKEYFAKCWHFETSQVLSYQRNWTASKRENCKIEHISELKNEELSKTLHWRVLKIVNVKITSIWLSTGLVSYPRSTSNKLMSWLEHWWEQICSCENLSFLIFFHINVFLTPNMIVTLFTFLKCTSLWKSDCGESKWSILNPESRFLTPQKLSDLSLDVNHVHQPIFHGN